MRLMIETEEENETGKPYQKQKLHLEGATRCSRYVADDTRSVRSWHLVRHWTREDRDETTTAW